MDHHQPARSRHLGKHLADARERARESPALIVRGTEARLRRRGLHRTAGGCAYALGRDWAVTRSTFSRSPSRPSGSRSRSRAHATRGGHAMDGNCCLSTVTGARSGGWTCRPDRRSKSARRDASPPCPRGSSSIDASPDRSGSSRSPRSARGPGQSPSCRTGWPGWGNEGLATTRKFSQPTSVGRILRPFDGSGGSITWTRHETRRS